MDKVICQLRFPPILRIESEVPAKFQDLIRKSFPLFSEVQQDFKIDLIHKIDSPIQKNIFSNDHSLRKNYEFSSEDGTWKVNLTRTFIALSTKKYSRREEFKEMLKLPLEALISVYSPAFFSRIGLRYVDIVKRSRLNLQHVDWSDLLKPYLLGMFISPEVRNHIQAFESNYEIALKDDQSKVRILTRLVEDGIDNELCYLIDSDFFNSNKTKISEVWKILDFLSVRGSRLFQWCITKRLYEAMEPVSL